MNDQNDGAGSGDLDYRSLSQSKAIRTNNQEEMTMATVKELRAEADDLGIETDGLKKADLEKAIRKARFKGLRFKEASLDLDQVTELVDEGSFASAAEELEVNVGEIAWHYNRANGEAIESDDVEELAEMVASARDDEKDGWVNIAGRAGLTRGAVRKLYQMATDRDPSEADIGRGGRGPGGVYLTKDEDAKPAKAKKASKAKAKAKPAKATKAKATRTRKAKGKPKDNGLLDWESADEDEIKEALEGKTVTTAKGDVEVASVLRFGKTKANKRAIQVEDEEGAKVAITLSTVKAVV